MTNRSEVPILNELSPEELAAYEAELADEDKLDLEGGRAIFGSGAARNLGGFALGGSTEGGPGRNYQSVSHREIHALPHWRQGPEQYLG